MKGNGGLMLGVALIVTGLLGLAVLRGAGLSMGGMMGGSMMDREDMKAMMSRMMGAQLPPGIDPQDLPDSRSEGARLFVRYCTQCHNLPSPGMHVAEKWPRVVDRMNRHMRMMSGRGMMGMMRGGVESPDDAELRAIVRYLQARAQQPMDKARYKDLDSPAGRAFQSACSRCHALPDPRQHTSVEWPGVVARMKQNMVAMGKPAPDDATVGEIIGFLQRHAKAVR